MATNKTITSSLPLAPISLMASSRSRAMEDYSYQVMDAQTANIRVGPGSNKNK